MLFGCVGLGGSVRYLEIALSLDSPDEDERLGSVTLWEKLWSTALGERVVGGSAALGERVVVALGERVVVALGERVVVALGERVVVALGERVVQERLVSAAPPPEGLRFVVGVSQQQAQKISSH